MLLTKFSVINDLIIIIHSDINVADISEAEASKQNKFDFYKLITKLFLKAILAFIMHLGAIPIPKTNDEKQMKENFEAQNIELNLKQMRLLKKLHIGEEARVFNFR